MAGFIKAKCHWLYFLILQADGVDGSTVKVTKNVLPCTLDVATKSLIELIFSNDMFKEAMECMNLGGCVSVCRSFNANRFTAACEKFSVLKYWLCNMPLLGRSACCSKRGANVKICFVYIELDFQYCVEI